MGVGITNVVSQTIRDYLSLSHNYDRNTIIDFPFPDGEDESSDSVLISITPYEVSSGWVKVTNDIECNGEVQGNFFMNVAVRGQAQGDVQTAFDVKSFTDEVSRKLKAINNSKYMNDEYDPNVTLHRINIRGGSSKRSLDKQDRHIYYFNIEIIYTESFRDILEINNNERSN